MLSTSETLYRSKLQSLPLLNSGKVREIYEAGKDLLLIVTSDRISAFDVILPDPIPGKGEVLTSLSNFWFARMHGVVPNHLSDVPLEKVLPDAKERLSVNGRAIVVRRLKPLPVEAIVRGYIIGSGWKEYQRTGAICGIKLPAGLKQASRLPQPIFTPSTKAEMGKHDENIGVAETERLLGKDLPVKVRDISVEIYTRAAEYALKRGIIIADTKFEFGTNADGKLYWIDEALTPDSSRFWPADTWREGISPPSFDKQYVRDYLETLDWNKTPPGPSLPPDVIKNTAAKYQEAKRRLME